MMLLPIVFFAAATATAPAPPSPNAPISIAVTISRYADPLLRRPLDPDVVPLKCEALIFTAIGDDPRVLIGEASVTLVAGERRSSKPTTHPTRIDLTCDVASDGHSAKTAVTVYRAGTVAAQQMTDIWLPDVKSKR